MLAEGFGEDDRGRIVQLGIDRVGGDAELLAPALGGAEEARSLLGIRRSKRDAVELERPDTILEITEPVRELQAP